MAEQNLVIDPLDGFARSLLWLAKAESNSPTLADLVAGQIQPVLDLLVEYTELGDQQMASQLLLEQYCQRVPKPAWNAMASYWAHHFDCNTEVNPPREWALSTETNVAAPTESVFPHRYESVLPFFACGGFGDQGSIASLQLGHLLFHLDRYDEARRMWTRAAKAGADSVIAHRALGMAAKTLDNDLPTARDWLEKASQADPADAIVARDLANVLFALADQAKVEPDKKTLMIQARDRLKAALASGRGRSDFVGLLARAQNRLGEFAETARLLDSVRVTVWEGAREVHDLFKEAHLALGRSHLEAGRAAEALAEFNRALEYPENLATGKLENAREALVHYGRGNALAALGQLPAAVEAWRKAVDEPASNDPKQEEARKQAREAIQQRGN